MIRQYMDPSVDPCQDFYQFSCRNYLKDNEPPPRSRHIWDVYAMLGVEAELAIRNILQAPSQPGEDEGIFKLKTAYKSCLTSLSSDSAEQSVRTMVDALVSEGVVSSWPPNPWDFHLEDSLAAFFSNGYNAIFAMKASMNSEEDHVVYKVGQISMDEELYTIYEDEYLGYMESTLQILKIPNYKEVALDIFNFEMKLLKTMDIRGSPLEEELTPFEMEKQFPFIAWRRLFNKMAELSNFEKSAEESIAIEVVNEQFFNHMRSFLDGATNRTLQNYLVWNFAYQNVEYLGPSMRELHMVHMMVVDRGRFLWMHRTPLWKFCYDALSASFKEVITAEYARKMFSEDMYQEIKEELERYKDSFRQNLGKHTWLDEETRRITREKLDRLTIVIGYPPEVLNKTASSIKYKNINIREGSFLHNYLQAKKIVTKIDLGDMKAEERSDWSYDPTDINAFNMFYLNQIVLPISILYPPFFQLHRPKYLNYASIGSTIAHEMGHTFDSGGITLSPDGKEGFWSESMIKKYMEKVKCYHEQYSKFRFKVKSVDKLWNAEKSTQDDISDQVGLLHAYLSYLKYEQENGPEPGLPGLNYTNHQLFFIMYSQQFCTTYTKAGARNVAEGSHSPGELRVIGTIYNSPHFGEVFGCPLGTPMNPVKKCRLWE